LNKKIILLALITITLSIYSQDFDESYLDSLPDDVREDVTERVKAKEEMEKPVYRSASSSIDKKEKVGDESRFGSNFFDTMQSSFMPINEPNLDSSYVLDFGDVLEIQLIGQKDETDSYMIKRDGSINIPDVGKVILSGLSLNDASSLIKAKINTTYIGTKAFVSLKNIRDINVLIAGNAFNPGIYTLNGNSNMLHALSMAGGINDIGSYRDIDLIRNGKVIDNLDIYEVLVFGKYNFSSGLRSGDSIVVKPINNLVAIESGVRRPAIYELRSGDTFFDVLELANGFTNNADKKNIVVKRFDNGKSILINVDFSEIDEFNFTDNDSVFIREYKINSVNIQGAVKNPGTYKLEIGTTLSQLVNNAGGYEESSYPFAGYLENKKALEVNNVAKDKLYNTFLDNLASNSNTNISEESNVGLLLTQIKESEVSGRVIAEFDLDVIKNNPTLDTTLEDGDRILIPYITQQVYVQGEISNPGATRYVPGQDIDFYIKNSGGSLDSADYSNIFIVHPNGETTNLKSNSRLSFIKSQDSQELIYPGSIIYVPQSTNFTNTLQAASIWSPIISSLALSLTSLSVLNNSN
jgi:protein involved in polysaccharide export with SLBB domain